MPIFDDQFGQSSSQFPPPSLFCRWNRRKALSLRHLEAARGYLLLEMPGHALRELALMHADYRFQKSRLRGEAFYQLDRLDEAIAAYRGALRDCPDALPVLMGLANCHRRDDDINQATATLVEANRLHPGEPAILFALARCAALQDDVDGALTWLGRAMRLCPEVAQWAETDPDFRRLRELPDFVWFVEVAKLRVDA